MIMQKSTVNSPTEKNAGKDLFTHEVGSYIRGCETMRKTKQNKFVKNLSKLSTVRF